MAPATASISDLQTSAGDWSEVGLLVLYELRRLNEAATHTANAVAGLKVDMAVSKARSSWWGAGAGIVGGGLVSFLVALLVKVFT